MTKREAEARAMRWAAQDLYAAAEQGIFVAEGEEVSSADYRLLKEEFKRLSTTLDVRADRLERRRAKAAPTKE